LNGSDADEGAASAAGNGITLGPGRLDWPTKAQVGRFLGIVAAVIAAVSRGRGRAVPWPAHSGGSVTDGDAASERGGDHGGPVA
jgi:hypothetical protein